MCVGAKAGEDVKSLEKGWRGQVKGSECEGF